METGPAQKSLVTLSLMAVVILAPAGVFAVTGDAPQTLILTVAGLVLSAVLRRPLERTTRSYVYTGLGALVLAVVSQQAFPVDEKRFFLLIPAHVYGPPILFLAVAITFLDHRDSNVSGVVGLALLAMMMSGSCMDLPPARRLPIPRSWQVHLHAFYGAAVAVQLLACIPLMARAPFLQSDPAVPRAWRRWRWAIVACLLALTATGTLVLRRSARHLEYFWQTGFTQFMHTRLGPRHGAVFGRDVDLWRTVPHLSAADETVVVRALSPVAPGYLRGRAYTQYRDGRWTAASPDAGLPAEQPGGRMTYSVFRRSAPAAAENPGGPARLDVYPTRQFRSDVLLAPGNATAFELIADDLSNNQDGELTANGWERQVGYTTVASVHCGDAAYDGPAVPTATSADYLAVPEALREPLSSLAGGIFGSRETALTTALADLNRFFLTGFRYELGTLPERDAGDPVLQFLTRRRSGHCELFATAAVLLLRSRGIPARYVTGLVCQEPLGSRLWAARLGDLHAWGEAFDRDRGGWVLVEVTPAANLPSGGPRSGVIGRGLERMAFSWQHVFALMKRGTVAEAIVAAVRGVAEALAWLVLNPVGTPVTLLLAILLARRWRHRIRARRGETELPEPRRRARRAYLQTLAALGHGRDGLPPQPTPRLLAAWVRARCPVLTSPVLAAAFERYELLRYGAALPDEQQLAALEAQFGAGLRQYRRAVPRDPRNDASPTGPDATGGCG